MYLFLLDPQNIHRPAVPVRRLPRQDINNFDPNWHNKPQHRKALIQKDIVPNTFNRSKYPLNSSNHTNQLLQNSVLAITFPNLAGIVLARNYSCRMVRQMAHSCALPEQALYHAAALRQKYHITVFQDPAPTLLM